MSWTYDVSTLNRSPGGQKSADVPRKFWREVRLTLASAAALERRWLGTPPGLAAQESSVGRPAGSGASIALAMTARRAGLRGPTC